MRARAVAGAVLLALAGAGQAQAATVVDAGSLQARVNADPWHLEFTDSADQAVLAALGGGGSGSAGPLGFRDASGWQRATRVISSTTDGDRIYTAVLGTTDPERTIELTLSRDGEGVIALDARVVGPAPAPQALSVGFGARDGERYWGFGERSNSVDQAGNAVENYVSDGPYQASEYGLINLFTPSWGLRDGHADATYFPVPWLLSSAGYGVLVDSPETSYFHLGDEASGAWSIELVPAPAGETGAPVVPAIDHLALRVFAGPTPPQALRRFTAATGRQPKPASPWVLGPWYQADGDAVTEMAALRAADAPFSALQTYTHYLPCGAHAGQDDAERERVAAAHNAGAAITTYFNPMICTAYQPAYQRAADAGALTRDATGNPYLYRYGADVDQAFLVGQFDFSTDAGRGAYAELLNEAIAAGYDGWMEDFGEYTPLDSVSASGVPGTSAHNPYATEYHCAAFDAVEAQERPVVRFQRSGWAGAARCAQVVWGGDPTTSFGFDGLRSAVTQALSAGASGIGIWGSDIGGFFALGDNALSPELLTRWVQLGAVSPVMRTQANGVAVPSKPRPQVLDPGQIENWRRYTKLHTQLYPYLANAVDTYRRTGMPVMRQLGLQYPADPQALASSDEFMFGEDLLAAPVLDEGATSRELYLPRGRWVDLWRSATYRPASGAIALGRARVLRGGRKTPVPAPLTELPLMVRAGTIIPMLPAKVDSLAQYEKQAEGVDGLSEVRNRLRLLAFPRGHRDVVLGGGFGGVKSAPRRTRWSLEFFSGERHRYTLEAALTALKHPFVPCAVTHNGRPLNRSAWSFDRDTGVLRARFATKHGKLRVLSCL